MLTFSNCFVFLAVQITKAIADKSITMLHCQPNLELNMKKTLYFIVFCDDGNSLHGVKLLGFAYLLNFYHVQYQMNTI